ARMVGPGTVAMPAGGADASGGSAQPSTRLYAKTTAHRILTPLPAITRCLSRTAMMACCRRRQCRRRSGRSLEVIAIRGAALGRRNGALLACQCSSRPGNAVKTRAVVPEYLAALLVVQLETKEL